MFNFRKHSASSDPSTDQNSAVTKPECLKLSADLDCLNAPHSNYTNNYFALPHWVQVGLELWNGSQASKISSPLPQAFSWGRADKNGTDCWHICLQEANSECFVDISR